MPPFAQWKKIWSEALFFLMVLGVFTVFRTTAYATYYIPSESMLPTLSVGDRIAVSKFSYGYSRHSAPFSLGPDLPTAGGRLFGRLPKRGDVVVFKHPKTRVTTIKRVIGLPGDRVAVIGGRLFLNDAPVDRQLTDLYAYREYKGRVVEVGRFEETLPQGPSYAILERGDFYPGDDYEPAIVPANHLFVMGDNRDNSLDSRFEGEGVGFLPVDHLLGRADLILFSTNSLKPEVGMHRHPTRWFEAL